MPENDILPNEPDFTSGETIGALDGVHHVSDQHLTAEEAAATLADMVAKVGAKTMTGEDREVVFKFDERISLPADDKVVLSEYRPATQSKTERAVAQMIAADQTAEALDVSYSPQDALRLVRSALAAVGRAVDTLETALTATALEDVLEESVVDA